MVKKIESHDATGRRKTAVARVSLTSGSGKVTVNGRAFENYFPVEDHRIQVLQPFAATEQTDRFDVRAKVTGGGPHGQATAVRHGIARALLLSDEKLRVALRGHGLLTRDSRKRERKKYGQPGARARFQFSKR